MTKSAKGPALDDVLDTYLAAVEEPNLDSAREWGQRFPEHSGAIRDFAASWMLAACLPADPRSLSDVAFSEMGKAVVDAGHACSVAGPAAGLQPRISRPRRSAARATRRDRRFPAR